MADNESTASPPLMSPPPPEPASQDSANGIGRKMLGWGLATLGVLLALEVPGALSGDDEQPSSVAQLQVSESDGADAPTSEKDSTEQAAVDADVTSTTVREEAAPTSTVSPATTAAAPTSTAAPTTTAPGFSFEEQQAIESARTYLRYSSFSRQGLIDQLEFEGFTSEQAVYGVDQVYE